MRFSYLSHITRNPPLNSHAVVSCVTGALNLHLQPHFVLLYEIFILITCHSKPPLNSHTDVSSVTRALNFNLQPHYVLLYAIFILITYHSKPPLNSHTDVSSVTRALNFNLHPYFVLLYEMFYAYHISLKNLRKTPMLTYLARSDL